MGATVAPVVRRPNPTAVGIAIWLASEVMFFGGLFAAYFAIRAANDDWPPQGIHLDTVRAGLFTLVLVASSFTLHAAERGQPPGGPQLDAGDARARRHLPRQPGRGVGEQRLQRLHERLRQHVLRARRASTACTSRVGLVLLAIVGLRDPDAPSSVPGLRQATTWYWHFVDVVWVGLFATIFLIQ